MTQVFDIAHYAPTKEDADTDNKVNWFHPRFGWSQGDWEFPCYSDVTHWARLPERPTQIDPEERLDAAFLAYVRAQLNGLTDPAPLALIKTGFRAGWKTARNMRP